METRPKTRCQLYASLAGLSLAAGNKQSSTAASPAVQQSAPSPVSTGSFDGARYWHTPQDTLDKIDPRSLAVVGQVFLTTLPALEQKFAGVR